MFQIKLTKPIKPHRYRLENQP